MKPKWTVSVLLLFIAILLSAQTSSTILLLPPIESPANEEAQDVLVKACHQISHHLFKGLTLVTFHRESPSLLRTQQEGKLPVEALSRPHEHAAAICQAEGAKAALWLRVTKADDKTPQAVEATLLFPSDDKFVSDVKQTITEEERKALKALVGKKVKKLPNELVLAWRILKWLQTKLAEEVKPLPPAPPADIKVIDAIIAQGKLDEALQALSMLVAENPTDPQLYLRLGLVYERKQRWDDAALEYRRATLLQSDLWDAWKGIARVAEKRKRWDLVLDSTRRLRQSPVNEPLYLALGAQAATVLAGEAFKRGRDREAAAMRKDALAFDEALVQMTDEYALLRDSAERLLNQRQHELALTALEKALMKAPSDVKMREKALNATIALKRLNVAYQHLVTLAQAVSEYAPALTEFRSCLRAMDAEAVRLFEQVRDSINDFNAKKLTRDDMMARLKQINADADRLLRIAYVIKPPVHYDRIYPRRLLSYELFLQATKILMQWIETEEELTYRRAVILYDYARMELETAQGEESKLR